MQCSSHNTEKLMKLLTSYNLYFMKVSHKHIFSSQGPCLVVADATALYLSMCRDTVTKYLECVLEKHPNFNTKACKIITSDNHSVSLANIIVHNNLQPTVGVLCEAGRCLQM